MSATKPALPFFDPSFFTLPFGQSATGGTPSPLDFPFFVASLMQGTFEAIVNSAIAQMEAYSELMLQATMSVEHFVQSVGVTSVTDLPAIQQAAALVEAEPTLKALAPVATVATKPATKAGTRPRKPRTTPTGRTARSRTTAKAAAKA